MSSLPRLVIVGRPNVGKSTLFNRLYGRKRALVHDEPGVTRDRLELEAEWWVRGKRLPMLLVDTGGLGGDKFADEIANQVKLALSVADIVIVLFDGQVGLIPADREVIQQIKRSGLDKKIPIIGVVNKVDAEVHETFINDFYSSNLDTIITISAEHGRGIADLQELVKEKLGTRSEEVADEEITDIESDMVTEIDPDIEEEAQNAARPKKIPRIAVMGRPNVGKSTLVNALINEDRMITSPMAGTTIDSVDTHTELNGKPYVLIDTAGIRRKSKTEQGVEVLSVVQSRKALERCDVAILLLDGESGVSDQDEKISGLIEEVGCGVILAVNKWDLHKNNPKFTTELASKHVRDKMAYLKYAPIMFLSGKKKQGFDNLGDLVEEILVQRQLKVSTREFTDWIKEESEIHNPGDAKFYMSHQSGRNPPTFVCHVSDPKKVNFSLHRHLINAIRDKWGYMGNPIKLLFVQGKGRGNPNGRKNTRPLKGKKAADGTSKPTKASLPVSASKKAQAQAREKQARREKIHAKAPRFKTRFTK